MPARCRDGRIRIRAPVFFFFSSRRRHTRLQGDWSSDVCSSDLYFLAIASLLLCSLPAHASLVLYGTRVIFSGDETEATLKISNEGKLPSLVQSWLDTGDGDMAPEGIDVPFVIAPSLTQIGRAHV